MPRPGLFVVLEGIDGAGTTTQAERLRAWFAAARRPVHVTREPSVGPVGSLLRLVLTQRTNLPGTYHSQTMALLFAADRLDHAAAEIEPHLRDGTVVISDRYDLSSIVYQSVTASSEPDEQARVASWVRELNRYAPRPDVTVVLDVRPEVAAQRRRARGGAVELFEEGALQVRLAEGYRRAHTLLPEGDRLVVLDGNGSPDEVAERLIGVLEPLAVRP
jgi:dTMP kinase